MSNETTFVLGGVNSGKSSFAESFVLDTGLKPVYIATGQARNEEMASRIEAHQDRRGPEWITIEEPLALADALAHEVIPGRIVLVECLTLWITNLMMAEANVKKEIAGLVNFLTEPKAPIVLVSNEVGFGVMPINKMAREFADLSGKAHQEIAKVCTNVYFVTAGLPQKLK